MASRLLNRRYVEFMLYDWLDAESLARRPRFADHGRETFTAALDTAEQIASADLHHLYLGHLSGDCNRPEIALGAVMDRLSRIGASRIAVQTASQDKPCTSLIL